jgi:hypothetical protein
MFTHVKEDITVPSLKKMKDAAIKLKIPDEIIAQIGFDADTSGGNPLPFIAAITKMDEVLSPELSMAVMERQGCCKGGQRDIDCKAFGKKYEDKPLGEKITLLSTVQYMMSPVLNEDNTITVAFSGYQNGKHTGANTCSCSVIKKLKQPFSISPTYCGCCAGHFKYHYQNALGVKLRLLRIESSPLNTNCEAPCSFTFEVLDGKR